MTKTIADLVNFASSTALTEHEERETPASTPLITTLYDPYTSNFRGFLAQR
ncbi:hypothetical protein R0135_13910 [Congregibacter variabilis]|uniref:Uncharacterized protein n=1 Tax=Congregibacter variabilis TaxID=3081200 RepID=A0ABZ0I048_9GAMM|nr:hypothetical protein R0135_13910 [Congregibacter sp. IMCC43200]